MSCETFVIIGAGHAGVRAAISLREHGFSGRLILIAEEGGQLPYERPPLSKWSFEDDKYQVQVKPIFPADIVVDAKIEIIVSRVEHIDRQDKTLSLSNGKMLGYNKLLIAAGASARRLSIEGADDNQIFHLRDVDDAKAIHNAAQTSSSAIIIGGGFIGLELAASLRQMGIDVHVVEMAGRLLSRAVSAKVADIVQKLHEDNLVNFHLGVSLSEYASEGDLHSIKLSNGEELHADLLIAGIGSVPNTALADAAGLAIDNGILVDRRMQTNDPHIFAAGDCCSFPLYGDDAKHVRLESWQAAGDHGDIAAQNMLGIDEAKSCAELVPWFWSEQYDHVLQVAGLASNDDDLVERNYGEDHHISFTMDQNHILTSACGIAPQTKVAKDIRLAMKIMTNGNPVTTDELSDPETALKTLARK